ncbi:hypothetical protein KCMC57_64460 (plasmid) [Kitasatospora sp. CMC57]|uniref:Transmembrane protein n=1 Tax=Kitasatospora sp. CMC57 TaxID=3231513 RepID=A0AB33K8U3_9ACTN
MIANGERHPDDDQGQSALPVCSCCALPLYEKEVSEGRTACCRCEQVTNSRLRDVAALWPRLPACTLKGTAVDTGGRSTPGGTGSAAPGNLAAISLLAGDVTNRLRVHEDHWRQVRGGQPVTEFRGNPDQGLKAVLAYLSINLNWACHEPVDLHALSVDLRHLVGEMTAIVTGERDPRVTIPYPCPYPARGFDSDDPQAPACGGRLRMDPRVAEIRCQDCTAKLPKHLWAQLGVIVGAIVLAAA